MEQVRYAIADASVIIFLVERMVLPIEAEIADVLRRSGRPVVFAANKFDEPGEVKDTSEFYSLGFGEPILISALHGHNVAELLDKVVEKLPHNSDNFDEEERTRIAVVGRANVGKSTYINALLGSKRVVVSEKPGTTRDPVEVYFDRDDVHYTLVDTGGIRKTKDPISFYSVIRTLRAINSAHIILHLIDANDGLTNFDKKIARIAIQNYKSLVIGVNKWDLMPKGENLKNKYREAIYERAPFLYFVPIVFLSALMKKNVSKTLDVIKKVSEISKLRIKTSELNELLYKLTREREIPSEKGKQVKFFYATQLDESYPSFVLFVKNARYVSLQYRHFIEKNIRETFGLIGVPVKLRFKEKK